MSTATIVVVAVWNTLLLCALTVGAVRWRRVLGWTAMSGAGGISAAATSGVRSSRITPSSRGTTSGRSPEPVGDGGPLRVARSFPLVVFVAAAFSACGGAPGASERLSDWLSVDARTKTVTLRLRTEYNRVYAGFNFNPPVVPPAMQASTTRRAARLVFMS